jgi:hypothetical protein
MRASCALPAARHVERLQTHQLHLLVVSEFGKNPTISLRKCRRLLFLTRSEGHGSRNRCPLNQTDVFHRLGKHAAIGYSFQCSNTQVGNQAEATASAI